MGRPYVTLTYTFWKLSPALLSEEWKSLPPYYLLRPHKMTTFWALRANPDRPGPYVYVSMGQASPTRFSAKAPRLRELEVVDSYIPLENLIRGQGIVFGLV